jgi:hypothetical protein
VPFKVEDGDGHRDGQYECPAEVSPARAADPARLSAGEFDCLAGVQARRVKISTGASCGLTSRSISVQPSKMHSAPPSASWRMIRRYSQRELSSAMPTHSSR